VGREVERSLRVGATWAFGTQVGQQVIRFLTVFALARLLTPNDYGSASLAVTLASYSALIGDLGFGPALVQAPSTSQRTASTVFWVTASAGVAWWTIAALGAYPAASILDEPEVASLVMAGGSTFALSAVGAASAALLTRSMDFRLLQGANLIAWAVASVFAVAAAMAGAGAWTLVSQQIVLIGLTSALIMAALRWRPSFEFSATTARQLARFALPFTGSSVFLVAQGIVVALLIGHLLGVDQLGIWTFAMATVILPFSLVVAPLNRVLYAGFARMRDQPDRMAEIWLSATGLLCAVVAPMCLGLVAVAPDAIPLVFGDQWIPAVPVIQILAFFALARALQAWNTSVIDAAGKPHFTMLSMAAVLLALPIAIWFGSPHGLEGVAASYVVAIFLFAEIPGFVFTARELSLHYGAVMARVAGVMVSSAVMCVLVILVRLALEYAEFAAGTRLALSILAGAVVYLGCLKVLSPRIFDQLLGLLRQAGRKGRRA
jgi:O-antigen/teichoic acid export membrane protein